MEPKFYKYCAVPLCHNTTIKTPLKLFVHVPKQKAIRKQWLQLARRDKPLTAQNVYYCEDHFDMPNDMENYMEYHIMGTTSQIRMKPGCKPTKFHCQPDKKCVSVLSRPKTAKRQRKYLIEECLKKEGHLVVLQRSDETSEVPSGSSAAAVEEPAASSPSMTNENEMAHPVSLIKVSTAVDEEMVYAPAVEEKKCGACGNLFSGRVYVCLQCEYQLCAECEASGHHGEHYVLRVPAHKPKLEQEDIVSKMRVVAAKTLRVAPRAKEKKGKSPAMDRNIELETSELDPLATDSNVEIKFEEDEDLDIDEHFGIPEVSTKVTGRVRKTNNKKTSKTPARTKTTPAASNTGLGTTRLMEIEVGQGTSSDSEGVFIKQEPEEPPESDTEISTEVTGSVRDTYSKKTSKTLARTKTTPAASSTGLGTTRLMEIEVEQATVLDSEGEVFIKQEPEEPPETDPEFQIQIVKVEELDDAPDQPPAKKTRLPNQ